jgi:hypothetical protein
MGAAVAAVTGINAVFGFRFSVKNTRIISNLKLKLVALETELGMTRE